MKILAFDSTARAASVAVTEDERALAVFNIDNGLTQSELLLPMAEDALRALKLTFSDIDLFAATVGPGSFTGVRIGAALIKGLAFGRGVPCVGISTIESLAENLAPLEGVIVPVMDARRSQVYTAVFESDGNMLERKCEDAAISISALAERLRRYEGRKIYLVGDGYTVARAGLTAEGITLAATPELLISENAYSTAKIAYRKYNAGEYTTDRDIAPTYLRVPQAERERLARLAEEKQ